MGLELLMARSSPVTLLVVALLVISASPCPATTFEARVAGIERDEARHEYVIHVTVRDPLASQTHGVEVREKWVQSARIRPMGSTHAVLVVDMKYGQSIFLLDLRSRRVLDRIWGGEFSFSPDGTRVVYRYRYPPHSEFGDVVLGYELTEAVRGRAPEPDSRTPAERGIILYPEENRRTGKYLAGPVKAETSVRVTSPFAWCKDGSLVGFLLRREADGTTHLVVLDVSRAFVHAGVAGEMLVDDSLFVRRSLDGKRTILLPEHGYVVAKTIRFTDDCDAVVVAPYPFTVFAEEEVTLRWK